MRASDFSGHRNGRAALVTAIAFLNRDIGTPRLEDTVRGLIPILVRAETEMRIETNDHLADARQPMTPHMQAI